MRGDVVDLAAGSYGECQIEGIDVTTFTDPDLPAAGTALFYLVQAQNLDCGLGSLGFGHDEIERENLHPEACAGVAHSDAYANGEATIYGSVTGDLTLTYSSDDTFESIEEVRTPASPAMRVSRLEHHWTFVVAAGTRVELHVEGLRTVSTDGDDFAFEYSTDGGSSWFSISMDSLPYSDENIDLVGLLPPSLSGNVTIRVIDTDRLEGHGARDTVSLDELLVRSVLE
jgi:hypothetical protein